jgi:uncharacterized protein
MNRIDPGLLQILCCPTTHQRVTEADAAFVAELNRRVTAGELTTATGQRVTDPMDGALLREDKQVAYAVRNGIPIMLAEEAIAVASVAK